MNSRYRLQMKVKLNDGPHQAQQAGPSTDRGHVFKVPGGCGRWRNRSSPAGRSFSSSPSRKKTGLIAFWEEITFRGSTMRLPIIRNQIPHKSISILGETLMAQELINLYKHNTRPQEIPPSTHTSSAAR
ncbi:hypothetical protein J6590_022639 [Homalodisca vitripennis]|nr:hypothetical protein J6590_022639 [Homalodisca vitripennis]